MKCTKMEQLSNFIVLGDCYLESSKILFVTVRGAS